jgi:hypothetical protein
MASTPHTTLPERQPFAPADDPRRVTAAQAAEGQDTVTMIFPRPVLLSTQDGRRIQFNAGVNEVPKDLADHIWLKHNGVTAYDKNKDVSPWMRANPPAPAQNAVMTDQHVSFLQSRGYTGIKTVADAQAFFNGLDPNHRGGFLEESAAFQQLGQAQVQTRVQAGEAGFTEAPPGGQKPILPHELRINEPPVPSRPVQPGQHASAPAATGSEAGNQAAAGRTNQQVSQGGPAVDNKTTGTNPPPNPQLKTAAEINSMNKPDLIAYGKSVGVELDPASKKEDMAAKLLSNPSAHK